MKNLIFIIPLLVLILIISGCAKQEISHDEAAAGANVSVSGKAENASISGRAEAVPPVAQKGLIEGKTLHERVSIINKNLHTYGSGIEAKKLFPDLEPVYVDSGEYAPFPKFILPFTYYYSEDANITINICAIDTTVFICPGKLARLISKEDLKNCNVVEIYKEYFEREK